VIGLYLDPPTKALVLCCDEKSQWLQSAERLVPNALGRCFQPLSNSLDADAIEPQQNDVSAFLVSRTDGGRPRPATKL
jgi:hypothetical protein